MVFIPGWEPKEVVSQVAGWLQASHLPSVVASGGPTFRVIVIQLYSPTGCGAVPP